MVVIEDLYLANQRVKSNRWSKVSKIFRQNDVVLGFLAAFTICATPFAKLNIDFDIYAHFSEKFAASLIINHWRCYNLTINSTNRIS